MANIKPLDQIAKKWSTVTPGRAGEYKAGVENPRKSWAESTLNAKQAYSDGVQAAISENRFEKGVANAGDAKWKKGAVEKGATRWPQGVALATDEYRAGFARYHGVIQNTTLPPKGPKGDPRNYDRVRAIGEALHAEKVSG